MNIERPKELKTYLLKTARLEPDKLFSMSVLAGGVSNRTVLLKREQGDDWVLKQALEKLRVAVDWFSNPERIHREAAGMRYLFRFAPKGSITELIFEDRHEHILAMQAVAEPHENWKAMLLRAELDTHHVKQFAQLLATIHREAYLANQESGDIATAFADRTYFENLRLEPYYLYTAEQVPEAAEFLQDLVADTRSRLITLVHGDYSPKNVLIHKGQLILLDHEVIHFGDPAFDVGFAMTHFLSKAHHLQTNCTAFVEAALYFWTRYKEGVLEQAFFTDLEVVSVRHTLACLLARVKGRSPLEYLTELERERQEKVVLALIKDKPATMQEMISLFAKGVSDVGD